MEYAVNWAFVIAGAIGALFALFLSDIGCKKIKIFPILPLALRVPLDLMALILAMLVVSALGGNYLSAALGWVAVSATYFMILIAILWAIATKRFNDLFPY